MSDRHSEFTDDAFLGGRLRLRQPRKGHRAGHDAMLLAASVCAKPGDRIVEFGAGVGAAGLSVASRVSDCRLALIEIDSDLADLARGNAAANDIAADVLTIDVTSSAKVFADAGLPPDSADAVLMNPPFNDAIRHRASPDDSRRIAHVASATLLQDWIDAARRLLSSRGQLTLIWRADGLADVLAALTRGFGSIAVLPVHGRVDEPAIRIIVRAIKDGRAPLSLLPALMLNDAMGKPTAQAQRILAGEDVLPLAKAPNAA